MKRLLAKSYDSKKYPYDPPDYALLVQHERDVVAACKALSQIVAAVALSNADLDAQILGRFQITLMANGWIQDLGKANSHFLSMVTENSGVKQLLRHETISGLLFFQNEQLKQWFAPLEYIKLVAIWGAMGHHRKFNGETCAKVNLPSLTVYVTHSDFNTILTEMAKDLGLDQPPLFEQDLIIGYNDKEECDIPAESSLEDLIEDFEEYESEFEDEKERRFLALVKAFGIAADVAASAVAKRYQSATKYSLQEWVKQDLSIKLTSEELTTLINTYAWKSTEDKREDWDISKLPPGFELRDFQNNVAASKSYLTLAVAGCGSGKSLAAYAWAGEWSKKLENRTNFRLFFCLPTTGTTTEHFKDYALESGIPSEQISLTHSRSFVDLETMATTAVQEDAEESADTALSANQALKAEQDKIEALALWSTKLTVTTADSVLGLMANARRSIYSIPAIMQSAIVFDEIHAFDDRLFGHLLVFLKNFPSLPVLLMTASLPDNRLQAIQQVRPDLNCIPGPPELETLPRYIIECSTTESERWAEITECIANGGKVLWVRNRVDWANNTYDEVRERFGEVSVNVYHSRLRYQDRSHRHRQVIDAFKQKNQPAILISTQVAEMSLDISADLLITDIAPVPSLIQRLGRLNRRAKPPKPGSNQKLPEPKKSIICQLSNPKKDALPYNRSDLETAQTWIDRLISLNCPLHQKHLADKFSELSDTEIFDYTKAEQQACFFNGLWQTRPGMTRSEGYTISVILQKDYDRCDDKKYGEPTTEWLRKYEVTIPFKSPALKWERIAGVFIAPSEAVSYDYNQETRQGKGAAWL
ncbi:MAG: CRISPR-associated helicase Cas3' [Cyanobacteria bacterium J06635_10]